MAFPLNPSINDTYVAGTKTYRWDGNAWARSSISDVASVLSPYALDTDLNTSNVIEGANLYFTNTRAVYALTAGAGITIASNGRVTSTVTGGGGGGNVESVNGLIGAVILTTADIAESGNLYFTNNRVYSNIIALDYSTNTYVNTRLDTKANVADLTTANVIEGANLYFTNARTYANVILLDYSTNTYVNTRLDTKANVADLTTANVIEGANLYYTDARVYANVILLDYSTNTYVNTRLDTKANVADLTTANVAEGANLYFTNARVLSYLQDVDGNIIPAGDLQYNLGSPSRRWKDLYLSGNTVYLGDALIEATDNSVVLPPGSAITGQTSDNIAEGNVNIYFSNTRVRAALSADTGVSFNSSTGAIGIGQNVSTTSDVTFANVTVTGNLLVQGNAVEFSANTLVINDPLIQVGKTPVGDVVDLGFFGHYIGGLPSVERHAGLFRDASDGQFKLFTNLDPEPATIVDTANASYQAANLVVNFIVGKVTDISNHTTSSLTEGSNLYFTNTRAVGALTAGSGISVAANGLITMTETGTVSSVFGQTSTVSNAQLACAVITAGVLDTSNVAEGSNLYYSNARAYANILGTTGVFVSGGVSQIANANITASLTTTSRVKINALGNVSGATTINLNNGNFVTATATGAVQWTITNTSGGSNYADIVVIELTNGGVGTQTWMTGTRWPSATAPTLQASGIDVLAFLSDDNGTNWRGVLSMGNSS